MLKPVSEVPARRCDSKRNLCVSLVFTQVCIVCIVSAHKMLTKHDGGRDAKSGGDRAVGGRRLV